MVKNGNLFLDVFQHQKHLTVQVDVSNSDSVSALSKEIYSAYNRHPSVIIHCAGILGPVLDSDKVPEETWHKVIDVQLKGTFLVNQTFAKLLKESGTSGSIVNISSIAKDGVPRFLAYSAAKAGICGITKTIAQEFGPYNIRCNVVAPGAITTPMQGEVPASARQKYIDSCALGRVGLPEEVASVCIFLGSDASSYVNGIVMEVHGGRIIS